MKKLTEKQKEKRRLIRQQITQLKRLNGILDAMEDQGYEFKKTGLNKIFKVSSERTSTGKMREQLNKLKDTTKADFYKIVKSFTYTDDAGESVTVRGEDALKIGKKKTRKKREATPTEPPTEPIAKVSIIDTCGDYVNKFTSALILPHPEQHNHFNGLYGKINATQTALGQLLATTWERTKREWRGAASSNRENAGVVYNKCVSIINSINDTPVLPSSGAYLGEEFNRTANIIYNIMTGASLPAGMNELSESISPIGTPAEKGEQI